MTAATILTWALQTGFAITLLMGFILLIRRPVARRFGAGAAYSLWGLPLIRLFMPPIHIPVFTPSAIIPGNAAPDIYQEPVLDVGIVHMTAPAFGSPINWVPWILSIWVSGAVLWLGWQLLQHRRSISRLHSLSQPVTGRLAWQVKAATDKLGFKRVPLVRLSTEHQGPLVLGIFRPVIILPKNFETNFSREQQTYALMHEMSHIRRGDLWAVFVGLLFRALNWPNPIVHLAARQFRADQEAACDAYVLGRIGGGQADVEGYAETLVHAAKIANGSFTSAPLGLTIYHPLKERLMTINTPKSPMTLASRLGLGACLFAALAITTPISLADDPVLAGEPVSESKQVIKMIEDVDGQKVKKHYEIITKDGTTTAWSIDEIGNRLQVNPEDIDALDHMKHIPSGAIPMGGEGPMKIVVRRSTGTNPLPKGELIETMEFKSIVRIDQDGNPVSTNETLSEAELERIINKAHDEFIYKDETGKLVVEKMGEGKDVEIFIDSHSEESFSGVFGDGVHISTHGSHSKSRLMAAESLLKEIEKDESLTRDTRRELAKALKAIEKAQKAIAKE